jgi:hypothetical protein
MYNEFQAKHNEFQAKHNELKAKYDEQSEQIKALQIRIDPTRSTSPKVGHMTLNVGI